MSSASAYGWETGGATCHGLASQGASETVSSCDRAHLASHWSSHVGRVHLLFTPRYRIRPADSRGAPAESDRHVDRLGPHPGGGAVVAGDHRGDRGRQRLHAHHQPQLARLEGLPGRDRAGPAEPQTHRPHPRGPADTRGDRRACARPAAVQLGSLRAGPYLPARGRSRRQFREGRRSRGCPGEAAAVRGGAAQAERRHTHRLGVGQVPHPAAGGGPAVGEQRTRRQLSGPRRRPSRRRAAAAQGGSQRSAAYVSPDRLRAGQPAADAFNQIDSQQLDEGMLLAIEADRHADTMDARSSLLRLILDTPQLRFIISAHTDKVSGVAVSPDNKTIASASSDGTIGFWDVATGKASHAALKSSEGGFQSVAYSPDGKYLASGEGGKIGSAAAGGRIVLWDIAGGYAPTVLAPGGGSWVNGLSFSRDGTMLAAGFADASATVYSVAARKTVCSSIGRKADRQAYATVAVSPDGREVAFGTSEGGSQALTIWSTSTCQQLGQAIDIAKLSGVTAPQTGGNVSSLAYSPDGKQLAANDTDQLVVLDTATWLPVRDATVIDENYYIQSMAYSPDGSRLAVGSNKHVVLLDATTGRQVGSPLLGARGGVMGVAFGADGRTLAAGSTSGDVDVYDLQNAPLATKVPAGMTSVTAIAFRPDGKVLASAGSDSVIRFWDTSTWQTVGQTPASDGRISALAFSPDGKTLASGGEDKLVHLWDASTGQQLATPLDAKGGAVYCLAFSPDGKWLAIGGVTDQLSVWEVAGGKPVASQQYSPMQNEVFDPIKAILTVGFMPDSSGLFFTMAGGTAMFVSWGAQGPGSEWTTRKLSFIEGQLQANEVEGALSPNGKTVALANLTDIRLADVASGNLIGLPMYGHNYGVSDLAFSPDGKLLASGGMDATVRVWDSATGQPVGLPLQGPSKGVYRVAFSPDGTRLVGVGNDGSIYVWNMVMNDWESLVCGLAKRNLSGLEWQQFTPDEPYRLTCPDQPIDSSGISQLTELARTQQAAGQTEQARTIISDGLKWVVASPDGDANNAMCWGGSLDGFAAQVMPACERAVSLDPLPGFRDSRGLARALAGDTKGAVEDFQTFVDWSKDNGQYDTLGKEREGWIASLKQGKNPFDQKTLDSLRS